MGHIFLTYLPWARLAQDFHHGEFSSFLVIADLEATLRRDGF